MITSLQFYESCSTSISTKTISYFITVPPPTPVRLIVFVCNGKRFQMWEWDLPREIFRSFSSLPTLNPVYVDCHPQTVPNCIALSKKRWQTVPLEKSISISENAGSHPWLQEHNIYNIYSTWYVVNKVDVL